MAAKIPPEGGTTYTYPSLSSKGPRKSSIGVVAFEGVVPSCKQHATSC